MSKYIRSGKVIFEAFPETHIVRHAEPYELAKLVERPHPMANKADPLTARSFPSLNKAKRHSRTVCGLGNVRCA